MANISTKPQVKIDEEILAYLQTEEHRTTIVHCRIYTPLPTLARIWDTTYLLEDDGYKTALIKAFNISMAPDWTWCNAAKGYLNFTLLFEGLRKSCTQFQVVEEIAEPGGFFSDRIRRNTTDVYEVELSF